MPRKSLAVLLFLLMPWSLLAQSTDATVTGRITDPSKAAIVDAKVIATNVDTGLQQTTTTGAEGLYTIVALKPGNYKLEVERQGFKTVVKPDIVLHVQDVATINFEMAVGTFSESITVEGGAPLVNDESAAVSTVVDRQFAENLPMNGRSFQTLIELTPGVVLTSSTAADPGQFSINGQRASSNYWMVDGVGANVGSSVNLGANGTTGGAMGTSSVFGGTNGLVSVDALQEFRIQTSTYAPEFGRTPGGQISIVTRSGTNLFHGSAFDYLRNDIFDASNWFNGYTNNPPLPKAEERQNDFGGTISGPILRNRSFFFFSYEGFRLRLPQTSLSTVPDLLARQNATPAVQPFINAYPFDPKQPDLGDGIAQFNASYSDPGTLDAYSLRIDYEISQNIRIFGRYNYAPSEIVQRGLPPLSLSSLSSARSTGQTATIGATMAFSPRFSNELRFNYSRTNALSRDSLDRFGGAVPLTSLPFPSSYTSQNAQFVFDIGSLTGPFYGVGRVVNNLQRQVNLVDALSVQKGSHTLKFGADYRRLSPVYAPLLYRQAASFNSVSDAESGSLSSSSIFSNVGATILLHNLGVFAQDTWNAGPRLTVTYGVRWDVDVAPSSAQGPNIAAATGVNLSDLSQLALAPPGAKAFSTRYGNVAPRVGVAYQMSRNQDWGTVVRGGFGVFYELATSDVGSLLALGYPFSARKFAIGGTFPLDSTAAAPPQILPPNATNQGTLGAFDPNLKLPYTLEWNFALEQALGGHQTLSASYVGAAGRRLTQTVQVFSPNPNIGEALLVTNGPTSDYSALQLQFQRRLSRGLQTVVAYTWSHSIDSASSGSLGNPSNFPASGGNLSRGPSDFDIRNAFSAGVTYAIPFLRTGSLVKVITKGWSLQSFILARSAPPVDIVNGNFSLLTNGFAPNIRPDIVPGIPLYLYGSQYPGGKAIDNIVGEVATGCPDGSQSVGPFCPPPVDANGNPLRQGNLGRNALRAFGATQWDFAVHRDFPIHDSLKLQFRAEMFNVLNHPAFAPPVNDLSLPQFGLSTQMLGQSLGGGNLGGGGLSPLYQIGGPRSMQFALKLTF